jgi:hypothetical protein
MGKIVTSAAFATACTAGFGGVDEASAGDGPCGGRSAPSRPAATSPTVGQHPPTTTPTEFTRQRSTVRVCVRPLADQWQPQVRVSVPRA